MRLARLHWGMRGANVRHGVCWMGAVCWAVASCGPTIRPSFDSAEPAARNAAIVQAAGSGDQSAIPDLVRMLESDDPTTRVLAIRTLERLTGETMGYEAWASEVDRERGVEQWQAYVTKTSNPASKNR
jgi:hypothetical protein